MKREFKERKGHARSSSDPFFKPPVQAKLAVGQPGDQFEQEADSVADKVVNKSGAGDVQKAEMPADEEKVQQKPLAESISTVQKKDLAEEEKPVQKAAAPEEKKEETVQKAVAPEEKKEEPVQKAEMPEEEADQAVQKAEMPEEKKDETVQKAEIPKEEEQAVQKAEMPEEKDETVQKAAAEEEEKPVQQKGQGASGTAKTEKKLSSSKGRGSVMSGSLKHEMESGFGADFSGVRLHTDSQAEQMTAEMRAQAFTHGKDIYFNKGKFDPNSKEGKHLLAHELTHTIQQEGAQTNAAIQCDFINEPTTPNRRPRTLTATQIQNAIRYNQQRHTDIAEIALIRDILGISEQPAVIDEEFIQAVVNYQTIYGLSIDGKIGGSTADRLAREIISEAEYLGPGNEGSLGPEFALKTSLRSFVTANSSTYADYRNAINNASMIQRFIVLHDKQLLRDMRDILSWNNFARCIELLGYSAPTYATLISNGSVRAAIRGAWTDSQPAIPIPGVTTQHEEGGWVYLNLISGQLSTRRAPRGAGAAIDLTTPPQVQDSVVVAKFHTHPNLGPRWTPGPSPQDATVDAAHGVPDIVAGTAGVDPTVFTLFLSGPNRREHLAGDRGLPGAAGGLAPQALVDGSFDKQ